jgi:predicted transcriptional regulator
MTRQAVTQHLTRLEDANLVATIRRGREKLHYLNPVPIHAIYERWIEKFEQQPLDVLRDLKKRVEGDQHGSPPIRVRDIHRDFARKTVERAHRR